MKEGGTSLNKTFREYNLVFKGLTLISQSWDNVLVSYGLLSLTTTDIGGFLSANAYVAVNHKIKTQEC